MRLCGPTAVASPRLCHCPHCQGCSCQCPNQVLARAITSAGLLDVLLMQNGTAVRLARADALLSDHDKVGAWHESSTPGSRYQVRFRLCQLLHLLVWHTKRVAPTVAPLLIMVVHQPCLLAMLAQALHHFHVCACIELCPANYSCMTQARSVCPVQPQPRLFYSSVCVDRRTFAMYAHGFSQRLGSSRVSSSSSFA